MTQPPDPPVPQINWRLIAGYLMLALGAPMFFLAVMLPLFVFTSRRGPPMAQFSLHHPITIVACLAGLGGIALMIAGRAALGRRGRFNSSW
jgi:hypothetical protein